MEPGLMLAAILSSVNVAELSGYDRVILLRAQRRMVSHFEAQLYESMASVSDYMREDIEDDPVLANEAAAAEIRAALRLTRQAADHELAFALDMQRRLPSVWEALCAGTIDTRRARVIVRGTEHLSIGTARTVVADILGRAPGLTTSQLAARIRHLAIAADPEEAKQRYDHAVEQRRVVAEPTEAGTTNLLGIDLPPDRVAAGMDRVNQIARSLRHSGETRSMDQLRADVLLDIIEGTGHATGSHRGGVDIRTDLPTLTRLNNHPGYLAGYGPVIADIARRVAEHQPDTQWRFTVTDPETGQIIATGVTRRRPTTRQRRRVEARNTTCIFPGCRMPAIECDVDHRIPYAEGGPTRVNNLAPACRHDHVTVRHRLGWTYRPLSNGDFQWTSRLGHSYLTSGEARGEATTRGRSP